MNYVVFVNINMPHIFSILCTISLKMTLITCYGRIIINFMIDFNIIAAYITLHIISVEDYMAKNTPKVIRLKELGVLNSRPDRGQAHVRGQ